MPVTLITAAALAVSCAHGIPGAQVPEIQGLSVNPQAAVARQRFLQWVGPGDPGGVLLIEHRGRVVLQQAFGSAGLDGGLPCDQETLFRQGEGARSGALRLLALRMAHGGRLSLDDPLEKVLPELGKAAAGCTLADLVYDEARLVSLEALFYFRRREEHGATDFAGAIAALGRMRRGAERVHVPTNMTVLGAALERALQRPLPSLMRAHVLGAADVPGARWRGSGSDSNPKDAVNFWRRSSESEWTEEGAAPLTGDGGELWLTASDALRVAKLSLREVGDEPPVPGLLAAWPLTGPSARPHEAPVAYFKKHDLFVVWTSNDRTEVSRRLASSIGSTLVGRRGQGGVLGIGGGAGGKYGGRFGRHRFDGRWPVGSYEIAEIDQPLVLSMDLQGKLRAHSPGFPEGQIIMPSSWPVGGEGVGTLMGERREVPSDAVSPLTGEPLMLHEVDTLKIHFSEGADGRPEPSRVTLEKDGKTPLVLKDLILEKRSD